MRLYKTFILLLLALSPAFCLAQIDADLTDKLVVDNNSDGKLGPGEVLEYTLTVKNVGVTTLKNVQYVDPLDPNTTLFSADGAARDDFYIFTGTNTIVVDAAHGVIGNNDLGESLSVIASDSTTSSGKSVSVNPDGSFTYVGGNFVGTDTFVYTVVDPIGNSYSATATLFVSHQIWFVDNTKNGTGSQASPFGTLEEAELNSGEGDAIFVYSGDKSASGMDKGILIQDNQSLIGQSSPIPVFNSQFGFVTLLPGVDSPSERPLIIKRSQDIAGGTAIVLGLNTAVFGFRIGDVSAQKIFFKGIYGIDFGRFFTREVSLANSNSYLFQLENGDINAVIDSLENPSPNSTGASLVNIGLCSGTFEVTGKTTAAKQGISIGRGSLDATFGYVNITNLSARGISYSDSTGSLTIKSKGGGLSFTGSNDSNGVIIADAPNFFLEGDPNNPFVIDGPGSGQGSGGSGNVGIAITEGANIEIKNVVVNTGSGITDTGISIIDSPKVTIKNTEVNVQQGMAGIAVSGGYNTGADSDVTLMGNSIIDDSSFPDNVRRGILVNFGGTNSAALTLNIIDNTIRAVKEQAIVIAINGNSGTASGRRNIISLIDNKIFDPGRHGIDLQPSATASTKFIVEDNEIDGQRFITYASRASTYRPWSGISIRSIDSAVNDLTATNNILRDLRKDQIKVTTLGSSLVRTLIDNNDIRADDNLDIDDSAITVTSLDSSDLHADISDNLINMPDAFRSVEAYSDGASSLTCVDLNANTGAGASLPPTGQLYLRENDGTSQAVDRDTISTRNNNATVTFSPDASSITSVASCNAVL